MTETEHCKDPLDRPTRRWHVLAAAPLTSLVGIYAILFAILRGVAYSIELHPESAPGWAMLLLGLLILALVLSVRLVSRMRYLVLLSALVVTYAVFFGILHVVAYLMGLQREPSPSWMIVLLELVSLMLALSVGLVLRVIRTWPKPIRDRCRLVGLSLLAAVGIAVYFVLPFTRLGWPPYKTSTHAFRKYVLANADINAMRVWLTTMDGKYDPNYAYDLSSGATIEDWWPEAAPWAKTITRSHPDCARLAPDHNGHPAIRIEGLNGGSLVVGSEKMQTPPADFATRDKYRLWLGPGAYVGHER